jgi:hypothetical protein
VLSAIIPDVVDQVLFHLLDAIDNGQLPVGWPQVDGSLVPLDQLGRAEMAGWLMMGKGGWVDRFSQERSFDPLVDLQ